MASSTEFEKNLKAHLQHEPFRPFLIELDDGQQFVVGERGAINYAGGETALYLHVDGNMDFVNAEAVRKIVELAPTST